VFAAVSSWKLHERAVALDEGRATQSSLGEREGSDGSQRQESESRETEEKDRAAHEEVVAIVTAIRYCSLLEDQLTLWLSLQARAEGVEREKNYQLQITESELSKQRVQAELDASLSSAHSAFMMLNTVEALAAQLEKDLVPAVAGISQMLAEHAGSQVARQHLELILKAEKEQVIALELKLEERREASNLAAKEHAELSLRLASLTEEKSDLMRQVGDCAHIICILD
jgi:hypothetical protein